MFPRGHVRSRGLRRTRTRRWRNARRVPCRAVRRGSSAARSSSAMRGRRGRRYLTSSRPFVTTSRRTPPGIPGPRRGSRTRSVPFYLVRPDGEAVYVEPGQDLLIVDSLVTRYPNETPAAASAPPTCAAERNSTSMETLHEGMHPRARGAYREVTGWIPRPPRGGPMLLATEAIRAFIATGRGSPTSSRRAPSVTVALLAARWSLHDPVSRHPLRHAHDGRGPVDSDRRGSPTASTGARTTTA